MRKIPKIRETIVLRGIMPMINKFKLMMIWQSRSSKAMIMKGIRNMKMVNLRIKRNLMMKMMKRMMKKMKMMKMMKMMMMMILTK